MCPQNPVCLQWHDVVMTRSQPEPLTGPGGNSKLIAKQFGFCQHLMCEACSFFVASKKKINKKINTGFTENSKNNASHGDWGGKREKKRGGVR